MKTHFLSLILFAMILASSCSQEEIVQQQTVSLSDCKFVASFEQNESRTYLEDGKYLRWTVNDEVSIFMGKTLNRQFRFTGETGDNSGGFEEASSPGFVTGNDLDNPCHYAIYPYAKGTKITETGVLTVNLPSEQTYAENSFGCGANTMVAVTSSLSDMELSFKNACGYLRFKLYGNDVTVKSVTLQSNGEEKLSGSATLVAANDKNPSITMSSTATNVITLDCGTGVKIGSTSETATGFWFVVPPTTFESGFTVIIKDVNGNEFVKSTSKKISIERNVIKPISAFEVEIVETIPNNQIWYTSNDGNVVTPYKTDSFGANIESNIYKDGKGIITFDGNVTEIGYVAFYHKTNLTSITIPEAATSIGERAFEGCSNIILFNFSSNISSIEPYAFKGCKKLNNILLPNKITKIKDGIFQDCTTLESVEIPQDVTSIGNYAFLSCALKTIIIPNKVTSIGSYAFSCKLEDVTIPDGVESIGAGAFSGNNFETITIPNSVTFIGGYAFQACKNLTSVTLSNSITTINDCTFQACEKLKNIIIPEKVTSIGNSVFANCYHLHSITIPNNVTFIGERIFSDCTGLNSIFLSEKLNAISERAFYNCTNLYSIKIPDSVKSIGIYAFGECTYLNSVTIPKSVITIDNSAFNGCTDLTTVTINDGTTSIGAHTFYGCKNLINISIPNSVTSIGISAFGKCTSIKSITIPKNITNLGNGIFEGCVITEIHSKATTPPVCGGTFDHTMLQSCILYVPKGCSNTYKNTYAWNKFLYIYEE